MSNPTNTSHNSPNFDPIKNDAGKLNQSGKNDLAERNAGSQKNDDQERFGGPSKGGAGVSDDSKINQGLLSDEDNLDFEEEELDRLSDDEAEDHI